MSAYVGMIEIKRIHYNFRPIGRIVGDDIVQIESEELGYILPGSDFHNLVLSYSNNNEDEREFMKRHFDENSVVAFDFELDDLEENPFRTSAGKEQKGYRTLKNVMTLYKEGKIRFLKSLGWSYAVRKDKVKSDFINDDKVDLDIDSPAMDGESVLVERQDDFWAGPYTALYREAFYHSLNSSVLVKPEIKNNKYTVSGYDISQLNRIVLTNPDPWVPFRCELIRPKAGEKPKQIDVISTEALLSNFKDNIKSCFIKDGCVNLDDIDEVVKHFESSAFMGSGLSDSIRYSRIEKIKDMISSEEDFEESLNGLSTCICNLLVINRNNPKVEEWVNNLVSMNPGFLDNFQSAKNVQEHIQSLSSEVDVLVSQKEKLVDDISRGEKEVEILKAQADEIKRDALIKEANDEYDRILREVESLKGDLGLLDDYRDLESKRRGLEKEIAGLLRHKASLSDETALLEKKFDELISSAHERMADIVFDGFVSNRMLSSSSKWESENTSESVGKEIRTVEKSADETVRYITGLVNRKRPNYKRNTIVNIAVCMTQGFLTVFSGEPGCGKTSICNIFADVLGLNKGNDGGRYVPVSIERGWTSKRDFVGYYNPLSKTFDKSNRRVYEALRELDREKKEGKAVLPYIILLDEANLSPMEYYWSDFMNISDDPGPDSTVNLGENFVFGIPETLHFVATINNDHTTETLSPRLIDRAWIVTLPQLTRREYIDLSSEAPFPEKSIEVLSWNTLKTAFAPSSDNISFTPEIQKCYDLIIDKFREKRISISPRIDRAIKRYWAVASKLFEEETQTSPSLIALDYAVLQRILPKINGSGDEFETWLLSLMQICSNNGLSYSSQMINDIIQKGRDNMKYYHFFG